MDSVEEVLKVLDIPDKQVSQKSQIVPRVVSKQCQKSQKKVKSHF